MKKKTVLIVEDSPGFSELMKYVVEDEGFKGVVFPLEENFLQNNSSSQRIRQIKFRELNNLNGDEPGHAICTF